MAVYQTEEERLVSLKDWWKENGRSIIVGIIIGIAAIVGWNAWRNYSHTQAEQASVFYQQLLRAVENDQSESAHKLSERLIEQYGSTVYGTFARLFKAKLAVDSGDPEAAEQVLKDLLASGADKNFKHVARIRLGKVLLASGEAEKGLQLIADMGPEASGHFEGSYQELRGDLYGALKRYDEARAAYQKAMFLGRSSPLLQLKLDNLPQTSAEESAQ